MRIVKTTDNKNLGIRLDKNSIKIGNKLRLYNDFIFDIQHIMIIEGDETKIILSNYNYIIELRS